jgi:IS30 family transposase
LVKNYKHIKETDRLKIYEHILEGESIVEISKHRATIYRELNRNSSKFGYRPDFASQQYLMRRRSRLSKIEKCMHLESTIIEKLKEEWSPQQIAGRLKRESEKQVISHESIYKHIYSSPQKSLKLYQFLRKKRRFRYPRIRRKRHKSTAEKVSIHDRPEDINLRKSFGHWEGDLILFSKTRENIFTLRERKTRFLFGIKNATRHAEATSMTLISYMRKKAGLVDSLTLDNDTAFAEHPNIGKELMSKI